ncbi:MAG: AI-2E family transporter [Gemmatimonadota bacterium]
MPEERKSRVMRDTMERAIRRGGFVLPTPIFSHELVDASNDDESEKERQGLDSGTITAISVTILAVLAFLYTLYVARTVILPVVVAILASFLLRGPVRRMRRRGIKEPIGAALVVFGLVVVIAGTFFLLSGPAISWVNRAPQALAEVERKVRSLTRSVTKLAATAERVEEMAAGKTPGAAKTPVVVATTRPGFLSRAFGGVASLVVAALSVTFLTFFLLASGDLFMRKLMKVLPYNTHHRGVPKQISDEVEVAVAGYLRTSILINIGLGICTWLVLLALHMPNAALWGTMAAVLNFIPYLGAMLTVAILSVAAITVFDTISHALLVPAAFLFLNMIESNLVTPTLLGRQFPLNTVALFIGVMLWGFLWGVPGAILAVPIMVTLKILTDRVPALRPFGEFLGQ